MDFDFNNIKNLKKVKIKRERIINLPLHNLEYRLG